MLERAHKAGAVALTFDVELDGYREDDTAHQPWECRAMTHPFIPNLARGRTGEEALRELVTFLERIDS